ncbi:Mitochondrial import inner membrane translocase subunit tim22-like protein [Elsinoe fawcettii]|nr:Mitochondrial import inner membrane translocase subunit tim22-like protein [Elsinoe fawcettii]
MAFPMGGGLMGGRQPGLSAEELQQQQIQKYMSMGAESCAFKTAMSGVMGFGLGGAFGLFMSSMRYDTPMTPQGQEISKLPVRDQIRQGFKEMGKASWSSARNFGKVALFYTGIECGIEGLRGKNEMENNVIAGCITGAILARNAGPQAMAVGAAGFGAFGAAIEWYLRMDSYDASKDPIT